MATSRREQAKSARRRRILEAAHDLLREVDMEGVTVKAIAQRSGLSAATIYNLFGSKAAVLSGVFDLDLATYEAMVAGAAAEDSLDLIFHAIAIAADLYRGDPSFYRLTMVAPALARGGGARAESGFVTTVREPRLRFWRRLVQASIDEGSLRAEADAAVLGVLLIQIAAGALMDWATDAITVDQLEIEMSFGFATVLASFAAKPAQAKLRRRMAISSRAAARAA
ncbi:MAG TPA: TetR/AcrR family transcriptional regulator [Caulobacteraceae bacterium]